MAIIVNSPAQQFREGVGLFFRQVEHHLPQIGRFTKRGQPAVVTEGCGPMLAQRERGERNVGMR